MPPTVPPAPTKKKQKKSHKKIKELRPERIDMKRKEQKRRKLTHGPLSSVSSPSPTLPPTTTVTPPPSQMLMTTPISSARRSNTVPNQFTARVQSIQKSQGVVLDDSKIIVTLRKRFVDAIKLAKKTPLDSKGLKKIANSNFSLSYNPAASLPPTRRSRSLVPRPVTQSQNSSQDSSSQQEVDVDLPDLPHVARSHGTIESTTFRRYLLEDIMCAPVDESWIILVSIKHPFYSSYLDLSRKATPLPLKYIRTVPFIQLKARVTVHCQCDDLRRGMMSKLEIERLLFGNGN
jgi:hypothetical protein